MYKINVVPMNLNNLNEHVTKYQNTRKMSKQRKEK